MSCGAVASDDVLRAVSLRAAQCAEERAEDFVPGELPGTGQFLGKYEIVRRLGRGATEAALLVRNSSQHFVVKQVNLYVLPEKDAKAATNEVYFLSELNHPNVVRYIDSFIYDARELIIVMEFADDGDLDRFITGRRGKLIPEQEVLDVFIQILLGLKHVHSHNMIHRDVKPQNIFMTKDKLFKLGDFGVAREMTSSKEMVVTVTGTANYLSPELVNNEGYNSKSDIWSLGCVLYELVTLQKAFDAPSLPAVLGKILNSATAPIPPQYSDDLRSLLGAMLDPNPDLRPTTSAIVRTPFLTDVVQAYVNQHLERARQRRERKHKHKHRDKDRSERKLKNKGERARSLTNVNNADLSLSRGQSSMELPSINFRDSDSDDDPGRGSPKCDLVGSPKLDLLASPKWDVRGSPRWDGGRRSPRFEVAGSPPASDLGLISPLARSPKPFSAARSPLSVVPRSVAVAIPGAG